MLHPSVDGRTRHFSVFYGLETLPKAERLAVVVGNCQAESVRLFLDGGDVAAVRIPPIHELTRDDLPHLEALLRQCDVVIAQPVRDGYHDLPIGTRQIFAHAPRARTALFPVIRFAGLYPWHAIVRPPRDPGANPPIVPYHDLRVLAEAAGLKASPVDTADAIRGIGASSLTELRSREERHAAIPVSDLFEQPTFDQMRTINHPGNAIFETLAARVRWALELDPWQPQIERPILNSIHAPRVPAVIDAWGLDAEPTNHWIVDGVEIPAEAVAVAHRQWYEENPDVVEAGVVRHLDALQRWGYR
jgi:hypothetical protein